MPNHVTAPAADVGHLEHSLDGVGEVCFFLQFVGFPKREVYENTATLW